MFSFQLFLSSERVDFICQFTGQFPNSYTSLEGLGVGTTRIPSKKVCDCRFVGLVVPRPEIFKLVRLPSSIQIILILWKMTALLLNLTLLNHAQIYSLLLNKSVMNDTDNRFLKFKRCDLHKHPFCLFGFCSALRNSSHKALLSPQQCANVIKDLGCRQACV